jgi:hypothetical protein
MILSSSTDYKLERVMDITLNEASAHCIIDMTSRACCRTAVDIVRM